MPVQLDDFIRVYHLPSGRAIYALKQSLAAVTPDEADIGASVEVALAHARATRDLELRHRRAKIVPLYGPGAGSLDAKLDRALSALAQAVASHRVVFEGLADDDPRVLAARTLDQSLFPAGVNAITSLSYIEEHESVTLLLARLSTGGDLAEAIARLGLTPFVTRISELNAAFGAELPGPGDDPPPTWDQIRAARTKLYAATLRVVAATLGHYHAPDGLAPARRDAILGPLAEQQRRFADANRRRVMPQDVDPDTGLELDPSLLPELTPPVDA